MLITLLEGAGNGKWASFVAHLRAKAVEITLWESPWGSRMTAMQHAEQQIIYALQDAGIVLKCGGVVREIMGAIVDALDNPPSPWVIGAVQTGTGKVDYRSRIGDFAPTWQAHFFQCPPIGMSREEFLKMK
jgi:hypothetical protein